MENWIRTQMRAERRQVTRIIFAAVIATGVMALLFLWTDGRAHLAGLGLLDSSEQLKRFTEGYYQQATLSYRTAIEVGSFTIDHGETSTHYSVWKLIGNGYVVLYCTPDAFADDGEVQVAMRYREFTFRTLKEFAPGASHTYVLYATNPPFAVARVMALLCLLALAALGINRMARWDKDTHLGRHIAALGDYEVLLDEINRQAESIQYDWQMRDSSKKAALDAPASAQAALARYGCAVLRDWLLLDRSPNVVFDAEMELIPIDQLAEVRVSPDEDDASMAKCELLQRTGKTHTIYLPTAVAAQLEVLRETILRKQALL